MSKFKLLKRFFFFSIITAFLATSGCTDDRASSVTGAHGTANNADYVLKIQADKTNMALDNTFSFSLTATRADGSAFVGSNSWIFSYSSNNKIDASNGSATFSLAAGESASEMLVSFEGLKASARGTAIITGTFAGSISVSTELVID